MALILSARRVLREMCCDLFETIVNAWCCLAVIRASLSVGSQPGHSLPGLHWLTRVTVGKQYVMPSWVEV